uniref:Uncharacterized protein n=1 Tax=Glossina palpalis gambiensis TaxID=67801 RepID=A0A1B0BTZ2_9MUSC
MGTKTQPLAYKVGVNPVHHFKLGDEVMHLNQLVSGLQVQVIYTNRRPSKLCSGYENYIRRVFGASNIRCVPAAIAREENDTLNDYYNNAQITKICECILVYFSNNMGILVTLDIFNCVGAYCG